jgi:hypothetical protein
LANWTSKREMAVVMNKEKAMMASK